MFKDFPDLPQLSDFPQIYPNPDGNSLIEQEKSYNTSDLKSITESMF